MRFNDFISIIQYKNKVVIGNKRNGYWIKISNEVYEYFRQAMKLGYSEDKFINAFELKDDREYIKNVYNHMKAIELIGSYKKTERKVTIELTNRCNLNCIHCCIDANEYIEELDTESMINVINKVVKWNPERLVLSGGEPLIRKDINYLLAYIRDNYKGYITFCTNGLLIGEDNIEILKRCTDQIDISIDGVDEESCKAIRGKGVFDRVIEKVKLLKEKGYRKISLSMVITDKNQHLEGRFYSLNEKLGTKPIIRKISIIGRSAKNYDKLTNLQKGEVYISKDFYDFREKRLIPFENCKAGKWNLFIRYNGDMYPCPLLINDNYKIGNIKKIEDIEGILNNNISINDKLEENSEKCSKCKVKSFCWACPATIKEYIENDSLDDYCNKVKKVYLEKVWEENS